MDFVECNCPDWAENIELVNGPIRLQFIRTGNQYTGKKFTHCPWCGNQLRQKSFQMETPVATASTADSASEHLP